MDIKQCEDLLTELERSPKRVQLWKSKLEAMIAFLMAEIFQLSKTGENDKAKMRLVALEYRARLLLERWRKMNRN